MGRLALPTLQALGLDEACEGRAEAEVEAKVGCLVQRRRRSSGGLGEVFLVSAMLLVLTRIVFADMIIRSDIPKQAKKTTIQLRTALDL
jgi:hypothetical protein